VWGRGRWGRGAKHLARTGSAIIVPAKAGRMAKSSSIHKISVIVPKNPFIKGELGKIRHCLAALEVARLMEWWPGTPHSPHRDPDRVRAIQRSLDWKRVAQIAAYLLQEEILEAPDQLHEYFNDIYEPKKLEPGRAWPPKISRVIKFERSEYPTFSNVLLHVNGAKIEQLKGAMGRQKDAVNLIINQKDDKLRFSVIDGQHRINGAYFAVKIREKKQNVKSIPWEIPSEIFLDLDPLDKPPRRQAQIFIDVNFYQKKVDRSLVADLFPTARGKRTPLDNKERAQDIGRKLMLEIGPLQGMIQIPGIKYGVKDVVTLATLNSAIEDTIKFMISVGITSLNEQTLFLAQCLSAWLEASGRKHDILESDKLDPDNVAYQGRVLVSALTLLPACIIALKSNKMPFISEKSEKFLAGWFARLMRHAGLFQRGKFIAKGEFKKKRYLGSGGIGRFRDTLWAAALSTGSIARFDEQKKANLAAKHRGDLYFKLGVS
jgi:DGQHR domain-containing protein